MCDQKKACKKSYQFIMGSLAFNFSDDGFADKEERILTFSKNDE
jgi:hypothetical protein